MPTIVGKEIGPIGYGLMGLTWKQTPPSRDQSFAAMKASLQHGANFWNGGELYGPPDANSLQLLNEYFTKYPADAEKVVLSIKGGLKKGEMVPDGGEENVKRSIDECLKVLDGKIKLDLFECARVDPKTPIEVTIRAMIPYLESGKLGGISLSECSADTIRRAAKVHKISAVEVEFSLWSLEILENGVAQACAELDIPIVAYSPLGRGFLTGQIKSASDIPEGDMRKHMPRFHPDHFDDNLALVRELEKLGKKKGCTAGQIGVAWVIAQSEKPNMPLFIPIPGASHEDRVKENSVQVKLSKEDLDEIDEIVKKTPVHGSRYAQSHSGLLFGNSPPLQE